MVLKQDEVLTQMSPASAWLNRLATSISADLTSVTAIVAYSCPCLPPATWCSAHVNTAADPLGSFRKRGDLTVPRDTDSVFPFL